MRRSEDSLSPPPRILEHIPPLSMVAAHGQALAKDPTEPKREFVLDSERVCNIRNQWTQDTDYLGITP